MADARRFLSVTEAAEMMATSPRTVRHWCANGSLPAVKTPGGYHRIPLDVLRDRADLAGYATSREEELSGY